VINAEGLRLLQRLMVRQHQARAETYLARALKHLERVSDASLLADCTAALVMARALRTPA
jgi:hypothetical protein